MITIREMIRKDIDLISIGFIEQGWDKPTSIYEGYLKEQEDNKRVCLVAYYNNDFAGLITAVYESEYPFFKNKNLMEIKDFGVLIKYQKMGVGTKLMDKIESIIKIKGYQEAGLCVGLYHGYGNAQNLYIKRGYLFDRLGISYNNKFCQYNEQVIVDDDLVLGMTKML